MNEPPGLCDAVGWLRSDTEELLAPLEIGTPVENRRESLEREEGHYLLVGERWMDSQQTVSIHYCRARSRKYDVGMLMIYPTAAPDHLPVFGAEWVMVGNRCHMAGMDVHPAGSQLKLDEELAPIFSQVGLSERSQLPGNNQLPEWATELARPWGVFVSGPESLLSLTRSLFREYLSVAVRSFYLPRQHRVHGGWDAPAVQAYKAHHAKHSPGRALLARSFGPERAEDFIAWHFGAFVKRPGSLESLRTRE